MANFKFSEFLSGNISPLNPKATPAATSESTTATKKPEGLSDAEWAEIQKKRAKAAPAAKKPEGLSDEEWSVILKSRAASDATAAAAAKKKADEDAAAKKKVTEIAKKKTAEQTIADKKKAIDALFDEAGSDKELSKYLRDRCEAFTKFYDTYAGKELGWFFKDNDGNLQEISEDSPYFEALKSECHLYEKKDGKPTGSPLK